MTTATTPDEDIEAQLAQYRRHLEERAELAKLGARDGKPRHVVRQLRIGRQVVPFAVIAALWAGAGAAQASPAESTYLAGLYLAVAVVYWWVSVRRDSPSRRRRRGRYLTVVTFSGAAWMLYAAHVGVKGWLVGALVSGGYALAAPYWYRHRIPVPPTLDEPAPVAWVPPIDDDTPTLDTVTALWTANVTNGGSLPGATLTASEVIPGGVRYTIQLVQGRQTTEGAQAVRGQIASALLMGFSEIEVLPHPSGRKDLAWLTVLNGKDDNPLMRTNYHPGFEKTYNPKTGRAGVGIHADSEWATWAFYVPGYGLCGGVVFGARGSGKSEFLTELALTAAHTGYISVWAGDPKKGQSIPAVLKGSPWPARSEEEVLNQIRAAVTAIQVRGLLNSINDNPLHVPSADEPAILLIIDELHKLTRDEWTTSDGTSGRTAAINGLRYIATEGRSTSVAAIVADQHMGQEIFGGDEALRANLWCDNVMLLRTTSNSAKGIVPGAEGNPALLPAFFPNGEKTQGLGYIHGPRGASMTRLWLVRNAAKQMAAAPQLELDEVVANGIGDLWLNRRQRNLDGIAARVGHLATLGPETLARIAASNPEVADALGRFRANPRLGVTPPRKVDVHGPAISWPTLPPVPEFQIIPEEQSDHPALRSPSARRIYTLVCSGVTRPAEIIGKSGYSESQVHAVLKELDKARLVARQAHGEWAKVA